MILARAQDPECPDCGCNASHLLREVEREGKEHRDGQVIERRWIEQRRGCDHCGKHWTTRSDAEPPQPLAEPEPEAALVDYPVKRCPLCGHRRTLVQSTRKPIRYHKCKGCGGNFQSCEA